MRGEREERGEISRLQSLQQLERAIFGENAYHISSIERQLAGERNANQFCEQGGETVGYLFASVVLDECTIERLGVLEEYRGRGLAKGMMSDLFAELGEREVKTIFLEVRESNAGAIAFYESCGFERIGERAGYYRNPLENAIVFRKMV